MTFPSLGEYNGNFVHARLAVGGCMRPQFIPALVDAGIKSIINMTGICQRSHLAYIPELPESIHWQLLGTWDGAPPLPDMDTRDGSWDPDRMEMMVEVLMRIVRERSPVLIHCGGGVSRSGNMAAIAYAALENITPQEAIERMREHRPELSDFGKLRWRDCDVDALLVRARTVLKGPSDPESILMMP